MTIYVPHEASAVLEGTPIFGSVDEITAMGRYVDDVASDTLQYSNAVQNAQFTLNTEKSAAIDTISAKLRESVLPGADAAFRSAHDAKRAFDAYASEIDRIHTSARNIDERVEESLSEIRVSSAQIEDIASVIRVETSYAWNTGAPGVMPEPRLGVHASEIDADQQHVVVQQLRSMHEQEWIRAASVWHNAIESIADAKTAWTNLIEERRHAEKRLSAALSDTTIGQLISVSADSVEARTFTIAMSMTGELWGTSQDVPEIATSHPLLQKLIGTETGDGVWNDPPDPVTVAANWAALDSTERDRLVDEAPWVIGNLPGLPFEVRDAANRKMVEFYQRYPQTMTSDQLKLMADIRDILKLEELEKADAADGRADPPVQLVSLDMTGAVPLVAVGYGNLDTASNTTWEVAGMNSDAHLALDGWDRASRNVYAGQNSLTGVAASNAVVAWLGYDTPNMPTTGDFGVLGVMAARAGAPRLAAELEGQQAVRSISDLEPPSVTVISHSYGTTLATVALTLLSEDHPVDALVMLGSAGLDTELVPTYDALRVNDFEPGQKAIFTTFAEGDAIAPFGAGLSRRGQPNPGATDPFGQYLWSPVYEGALSFSSEGEPSRGLVGGNGHSITGEGERSTFMGSTASQGHGYLDQKTQALDTVVKISTDLIDEELWRSFTRTEGSCVEVIIGQDGTAIPHRVKCETE